MSEAIKKTTPSADFARSRHNAHVTVSTLGLLATAAAWWADYLFDLPAGVANTGLNYADNFLGGITAASVLATHIEDGPDDTLNTTAFAATSIAAGEGMRLAMANTIDNGNWIAYAVALVCSAGISKGIQKLYPTSDLKP